MGLLDFFKKHKKEPEVIKRKFQDLEQPEFSKVNIKKLNDYYHWKLKYGLRKVSLDLNFEIETTNQSELDKILIFVNRIPEFDVQNQNYIKVNQEQDVSMTSDYLNFYLDELDENELAEIIDIKNQKKSKKSQLMGKLNLIRVGIYPQASYYATFDYSIDVDGEPCNQLLVVNIKYDGTLDHITWES